MKRRLDLALALVHRPTILFLDEPTTGLDPQSRSALWAEVARLAREEGVTVFLTTQYLEEADALADRVGIIDHGQIVAEGTTEALKAEIGRPTVEAIPARRDRPGCVARILERFGEPTDGSPKGVAVRLAQGARTSPRSSARSTREGIERRAPRSSTRRPSTTSSSPRPGARSRAPRGRGGDRGSRPMSARRRRSGTSRRRSVRPHAPAAGERRSSPFVFPMMLLAVNSAGLASATQLPGFPSDSFLAFSLAFPFIQGALFATMNAGTDLARDIQTGFLNRLALTPMRGGALIAGQLAGVVAIGFVQAVFYLSVGLIVGVAPRVGRRRRGRRCSSSPR